MAGQSFRWPIVPPYYIEDCWISNGCLSCYEFGVQVGLCRAKVYLKLNLTQVLTLVRFTVTFYGYKFLLIKFTKAYLLWMNVLNWNKLLQKKKWLEKILLETKYNILMMKSAG